MKNTYVDYDKIRRIMKAKKITIKELANRIGVHHKTLGYDFKKCNMKVSTLLDICNELDICIKDVLVEKY